MGHFISLKNLCAGVIICKQYRLKYHVVTKAIVGYRSLAILLAFLFYLHTNKITRLYIIRLIKDLLYLYYKLHYSVFNKTVMKQLITLSYSHAINVSFSQRASKEGNIIR